jgi:hypothetical protein
MQAVGFQSLDITTEKLFFVKNNIPSANNFISKWIPDFINVR